MMRRKTRSGELGIVTTLTPSHTPLLLLLLLAEVSPSAALRSPRWESARRSCLARSLRCTTELSATRMHKRRAPAPAPAICCDEDECGGSGGCDEDEDDEEEEVLSMGSGAGDTDRRDTGSAKASPEPLR